MIVECRVDAIVGRRCLGREARTAGEPTATAGARLDPMLRIRRRYLRVMRTAASALLPIFRSRLNASAREAITHDAVDRGWLHRLRHGQRTDADEQMALRIRRFRRDLRKLATDQGHAVLAGPLLGYALHFGMIDVAATDC